MNEQLTIRPMVVLLEDEPTQVKSYTARFPHWDWHCFQSTADTVAFIEANRGEVTLVLLDMMMQDPAQGAGKVRNAGYRVLEKLNGSDNSRRQVTDPRYVVYTVLGSDESLREDCIHAGADAFVDKQAVDAVDDALFNNIGRWYLEHGWPTEAIAAWMASNGRTRDEVQAWRRQHSV